MADKSIVLSEAEVVQAFIDWETDVRVNPSDYRSRDDVLLMDVHKTAKESARHFLSLVKQHQVIKY